MGQAQIDFVTKVFNIARARLANRREFFRRTGAGIFGALVAITLRPKFAYADDCGENCCYQSPEDCWSYEAYSYYSNHPDQVEQARCGDSNPLNCEYPVTCQPISVGGLYGCTGTDNCCCYWSIFAECATDTKNCGNGCECNAKYTVNKCACPEANQCCDGWCTS